MRSSRKVPGEAEGVRREERGARFGGQGETAHDGAGASGEHGATEGAADAHAARQHAAGVAHEGRVAADPRLADAPPEAARRVLGGQGKLWTEYLATRDRLDYLAYPRASALAEVLWTPPGRRRYADFLERLAAHRARFLVQGVNARPRP